MLNSEYFFKRSSIMETNEVQEETTVDGLLVTGFLLGEAAFGIEARLVQEVVKVGDVTPVHGAPSGVTGIRNLRGRVVTVVDTATHLGLGMVDPGVDARLLIMERDGESYGFLVDAVTDAMAMEKDLIAPAPSSMDAALRARLRGVWREGDQLTAILDPEELFRWSEE
jgi:purine-binding chemotaxis protein CheW